MKALVSENTPTYRDTHAHARFERIPFGLRGEKVGVRCELHVLAHGDWLSYMFIRFHPPPCVPRTVYRGVVASVRGFDAPAGVEEQVCAAACVLMVRSGIAG